MEVAPRILLAGSYGQGNLGDEAICDAMVAGIRRRLPDARLTVVSGDVDDVRARLQVATVPWSEWALIAEEVVAADLVVEGGGGLFFDWDGFDPARVLEDAAPDLAHYLGFPALAALLGRPFALAAVGVGPLRLPLARDAVAAAAGVASPVTVRDTASAALLAELGADPELVEVTADPAFTLVPAPAPRVDAILDLPRLRHRAGPLVAVVLRPWPHGGGWEPAVVASCARFATRTGATLLLVPFHRGMDEAPLRALQAAMPSGTCVLLPAGHSGAEVAGVLGRCELVVAMRLHGVILAAVGGTPVVGLAYDPKVAAALASLGQPDLAVGLDELGRLDEALDRAWARRETLRGELASAARRLGSRAEVTFERVLGRLESPARTVTPAALATLVRPAVDGLLRRARAHRWECERIRREDEARAVADRAGLAAAVEERDHIVRGLQQELHAKVGERDRIIRELQAEMHSKVAERDTIIQALQRRAGRSR